MATTSPRPLLLDDLPVNDDVSLWPGLREMANQVAHLMPALPLTSPILVSGDWGSGKTSLLMAVHRRLGALDPPVPAVWFDAWRYEGAGPLLPALMRQIWESAPASVRQDEAAGTLFRKVFNLAGAIALRAAPAVLGLSGLGAVSEVAKSLMISPSSLKDDASSLVSTRGAGVPADPVAELWRSFTELVQLAWPGGVPVIFVDDLDRCSPMGAVSLLDDIRMLVAGASQLGCKFVVAMDRRVLANAVAAKFRDISGYDGNRYLEKVFPFVFTLPQPQGRDVARLVTTFLAPAGHTGVSNPPNPDHQDALSMVLNDPIFANPRLMKRCINRFRMVVAFEAAAGPAPTTRTGSDTAGADRTLAKWIAATERFRLLRGMLVQHGEEYWRELEEALSRPGAQLPSAEADELLKDEGALPWVRREIFGGGAGRLAQLREAEGRLRRWGL